MIVIRCDATAAIGGGHVARMIALAEELTELGMRVTFVADLEVPWLRQLVTASWALEDASTDIAEQVALMQRLETRVLVIDSYVIDLELAVRARAAGIKVVAIADHSSPRYQADLVVVAALDDVDALEFGADADLIGGLDYVLIRRSLRDLRQRIRPPNAIPKIWVLMGGTDSLGVISQVSADIDIPVACEVNLAPVMPGGLPPTVADSSVVTVAVHEPRPDLLESVQGADLVVSAAGVSSFELLHLGLPTALLQVADNQALNFELIVARDLAMPIHASLPIDPKTFWTEVAGLLARDDLSQFGARAAAAVDGLGAHRTATAIGQLLD